MKSLTFDAKKTLKGKFKPSTAAERAFYKSLKRVAQISGGIINSHVDDDHIKDPKEMQKALDDYSKRLEPWAVKQSKKLIDQVMNSNKRAYQNKSKAIGKAIDFGVGENNVLVMARQLMREQVALIKSIPTEAGLRAQKISFEAALHGTRAQPNQDTINELKEQLDLSTEVATSRALLISRTETARANASINQARAQSVGSNQYRWHNSGDAAVRHSHKVYKGRRLQGMIFSWDDPPTLSDGMRGHPGTFPNCRCFAEPVFDDE